MKEKFKDLICILWAYFGAIVIGNIFLLGTYSKNISGNVVKIYDHASPAFSVIGSIVLAAHLSLIIIMLVKRRYHGNF